MADHIRQTIADLQKRLAEDEKKVLDTKRLINQLSEMGGFGRVYADADLESHSIGLTIRSDQFYGQPLATSVRDILIMRKALNRGAATVNEIYAALMEGGFKFDTKNDDNAKRGMRISLAKNNAMFHKLPAGTFGLREWYPSVKTSKTSKSDNNDDTDVDTDVEEGETE